MRPIWNWSNECYRSFVFRNRIWCLVFIILVVLDIVERTGTDPAVYFRQTSVVLSGLVYVYVYMDRTGICFCSAAYGVAFWTEGWKTGPGIRTGDQDRLTQFRATGLTC